MSDSNEAPAHGNKVPQVTFAFWVIKIAATTLGEVVDALSMTLNLGYAVSTVIFFGLFAATVTAQIRARGFDPFLYWTVIVATTTVGTTMADPRSLAGDRLRRRLPAPLRAGARGARRLVAERGLGSVQDIGRPACGGLLLGDHPRLEHAGHGARRLPRRQRRARLPPGSAGLRRRAGGGRAALAVPRGLEQHPVLGGLHPDPAAGSDARGLPHQAHVDGRVEPRPLLVVGSPAGSHDRADRSQQPAARAKAGARATA